MSSRQPLFTEKNFTGLMSDERVAFDPNYLNRDDDDSVINSSCTHFNSASPGIHLTDERVGSDDRVDDVREFLDNIDSGCLDSKRSANESSDDNSIIVTETFQIGSTIPSLLMADHDVSLRLVVYPTARSVSMGCEPMTGIRISDDVLTMETNSGCSENTSILSLSRPSDSDKNHIIGLRHDDGFIFVTQQYVLPKELNITGQTAEIHLHEATYTHIRFVIIIGRDYLGI